MAACGKPDIAVRLIKSAIEGRYCAYTALQTDPLLVTLRSTPEFSSVALRRTAVPGQFSLGESPSFALTGK